MKTKFIKRGMSGLMAVLMAVTAFIGLGTTTGMDWFKERGQWADNSVEPSPGMIIFFDCCVFPFL